MTVRRPSWRRTTRPGCSSTHRALGVAGRHADERRPVQAGGDPLDVERVGAGRSRVPAGPARSRSASRRRRRARPRRRPRARRRRRPRRWRRERTLGDPNRQCGPPTARPARPGAKAARRGGLDRRVRPQAGAEHDAGRARDEGHPALLDVEVVGEQRPAQVADVRAPAGQHRAAAAGRDDRPLEVARQPGRPCPLAPEVVEVRRASATRRQQEPAAATSTAARGAAPRRRPGRRRRRRPPARRPEARSAARPRSRPGP